MEKKFTVSAKIKGVTMEFIPKELAGCISTKKNAFIGHCAKRPRDDALVDEYNINDRAMILKIGRYFFLLELHAWYNKFTPHYYLGHFHYYFVVLVHF